MVDRYKQAALPFAGPEPVREYYSRVPLGSVVWTIARIPSNSQPQDRSELLLPGSWSSLLPRGSVVIASARPLGELHLRAQVITPSDSEARSFTERVGTFLALFKSLDISLDGGGPDPDVKKGIRQLPGSAGQKRSGPHRQRSFRFFQENRQRHAHRLRPRNHQAAATADLGLSTQTLIVGGSSTNSGLSAPVFAAASQVPGWKHHASAW